MTPLGGPGGPRRPVGAPGAGTVANAKLVTLYAAPHPSVAQRNSILPLLATKPLPCGRPRPPELLPRRRAGAAHPPPLSLLRCRSSSPPSHLLRRRRSSAPARAARRPPPPPELRRRAGAVHHPPPPRSRSCASSSSPAGAARPPPCRSRRAARPSSAPPPVRLLPPAPLPPPLARPAGRRRLRLALPRADEQPTATSETDLSRLRTKFPRPFQIFARVWGVEKKSSHPGHHPEPPNQFVRRDAMSSAQDPFYIVREEIQDSIDKLQSAFHRWEQTASNTGEYVHLTKELLTSCESIEWQVDELEKTISVASRDPAYYGLDEVELSRRRNWTGSARNQVGTVRRAVEKGKSNSAASKYQDSSRTNLYSAQDNDDFISSESDRQLLLMRQQDEELDELSESVQRIGGVGLTIHEELSGQERILNDLSLEMETTSNRLDFVQKRVAMVMKKAGIKGQIMLIAFLVVLFIILFVLVFLA